MNFGMETFNFIIYMLIFICLFNLYFPYYSRLFFRKFKPLGLLLDLADIKLYCKTKFEFELYEEQILKEYKNFKNTTFDFYINDDNKAFVYVYYKKHEILSFDFNIIDTTQHIEKDYSNSSLSDVHEIFYLKRQLEQKEEELNCLRKELNNKLTLHLNELRKEILVTDILKIKENTYTYFNYEIHIKPYVFQNKVIINIENTKTHSVETITINK